MSAVHSRQRPPPPLPILPAIGAAAIVAIVWGIIRWARSHRPQGVFWAKKKEVKVVEEETSYDLVIKVDSVLSTVCGWEVKTEKADKFFQVEDDQITDKEISEVVMCALGLFNTGKTWFLNTLFRTSFASGNLVSTEGLSIVCPDSLEGTNVAMLDTAGSDEAVKQEEYLTKRITEAFLRELVVQLSDVICVVVNRLHATDQAYLRAVVELARRKPGSQYRIVVIHNLSSISTNRDVEVVIKKDILGSCNAERNVMIVGDQHEPCSYFISTQPLPKDSNKTEANVILEHFIFAREGSEASLVWNRLSKKAIIMILQSTRNKGRKLRLCKEICEYSSTRLPQLLTGAQNMLMEPKVVDGKIFLQERATQQQDQVPTRTLVDNVIVIDGGNLYGGNKTPDPNQSWTPNVILHEFENRYLLVVEMAGFGNGDIKLHAKAHQMQGGGEIQSLTIRSTRDRKILAEEGDARPRSTWHNQIACGGCSVEVVIPTRVKLTAQDIQRECKNGLWFITLKKEGVEQVDEEAPTN